MSEDTNNETQVLEPEAEGSETPEGELEVTPGPEDEYEQPEAETKRPDYLLPKFKSLEDQAKAYAELEPKYTKAQQEATWFKETLERRLSERAQEPPKREPEPEPVPEMSEKEWEEYTSNPKVFLAKTRREEFRQLQREMAQAETHVESYSKEAFKVAEDQVFSDPDFADIPPAVLRAAAKLFEEDNAISRIFNSVVNVDNYKTAHPNEVVSAYKELLMEAIDKTMGRAARHTVRNAKIKAQRDAQASYNKKARGAGGMKPASAPKHVQSKPKQESDADYLKRLSGMK